MCVTLPFVCSWVFVFVQKENFQSFDNNLSRCHPFFFVRWHSLCVWLYILSYVLFMMSHIPRQQPVNMSHLSDVISFVRWPTVCVTVCLVCNWVLVLVRMSHPSAAACQCPIFRRVAHCVCDVRLVCNCVLVLVRMSHPSAAACQDVPSFVGWPIVCDCMSCV